MPLIFNGTEVDTLVFNGVEADNYIHNGVEVFSSATVASNVLFTVNYRGDQLDGYWSWLYRLNYDSLSVTEVSQTAIGSLIVDMVWDPDTNAYYLVERTVILVANPFLRFLIKKSTNNGSTWSTIHTVDTQAFVITAGRLAVKGRNIIEFYVDRSDVGSPGSLVCYRTTNGSSFGLKWESAPLTAGYISDIDPVGTTGVAVSFVSPSSNIKARVLSSGGNILSTLEDSLPNVYYGAYWNARQSRIYWVKLDDSIPIYQLLTTHLDLTNSQVIDSGESYMSTGQLYSAEHKTYYSVGFDIRSYDTDRVVHESRAINPTSSAVSQGRHVITGAVTSGSVPTLHVSYNRGVNWHNITLPNRMPSANFIDVGNITY